MVTLELYLKYVFVLRYVLFDKNGKKIGGWTDKKDIPQEYRNACFLFATTDDNGAMLLTIQV